MTFGIAKTADEDERNEYGLPPVSVTAQERAYQTTHVDQSVNKALPWVAFSWFLSGGAIIGLVLMALLMPELIDSRVAAGIANARAGMEERLAETKQLANAGREHGRIALSEVERANAELAAKGLIRKAEH
jgi:hypothetical protein